jgi:DMSO/TMAO reductase YedYZ heme-binding membrane subunit
MKTYFKIIKYIQETLLILGVGTLVVVPLFIVFATVPLSYATSQTLYAISHWFLFFVMMIRPLADIFTKTKWIRPLVPLRKGAGVMSAAIIVSFIMAKLIVSPMGYIGSIGTLEYWSLYKYSVLGHMADLSAIILLVTSNSFSKRVLGSWWKKIQKLSYVYFYGSALYVFFSYGDTHQLIALIVVTLVTFIAFIKNKKRGIPQTV